MDFVMLLFLIVTLVLLVLFGKSYIAYVVLLFLCLLLIIRNPMVSLVITLY